MFEELKERFTIELVLLTPDLDKEMRIEVDVSDFAVGGVLSIKCEDEKILAIIRCLETEVFLRRYQELVQNLD